MTNEATCASINNTEIGAKINSPDELREKIYKILKNINKPSRYIGKEIGAIEKEFSSVDLRTCLLFPDMYEVAVSNLGQKIFYSLINNYEGKNSFLADRVYAPSPDFKEEMKKHNIPLYALDSFRAISEFDVIAVSLQYELSYPTILAMFEMAQIPIRTTQRVDGDPIIIAGGPGSYNPEPICEFIDAFIVGDGEEVIIEIYEHIANLKKQSKSRVEILRSLSEIEGVYVPTFYDQKKLIKRRITNFSDDAFPVDFPIPYSSSVHDRVVVEIKRGCGRMCRFCQPCFVNLPIREREPESIVDLIGCSLKKTGYDEYSLLSLSSNDYDGIEQLVTKLNSEHSQDYTSISLPSQRADSFSLELAKQVQSVRKSTLTFAPEAGSQRLRDVINKNLTKEQIFQAVLSAYKAGWSNVKLYFMIGLPTETFEDLDAIIELIDSLKAESKQIRQEFSLNKHLDINCTVSIFVPKPFTPFQWCAQDSLRLINEKISYLKQKARKFKGVKISVHDSFLCQLEAAFTRGDRKLNNLIEAAFQKGSYLDAWNEHFNKALWYESASELGVDLESYSTREIPLDSELPWDFIDPGVKKDWLKTDYKKALEHKISAVCEEKCVGCGACGHSDLKKDLKSAKNIEIEKSEQTHQSQLIKYKYRMKINKLNELKFISHLDFQSMLYKAVKKAGLKVAYSQGFNPSPKISLAIALPIFLESEGEYIDIELVENLSSDELQQKLNEVLPQNSRILNVLKIPENEEDIDHKVSWAEYVAVLCEKNSLIKKDLACNISSVLSNNELLIEKTTKKGLKKQINIRPSIHSIILDDSGHDLKINFILRAGQSKIDSKIVPALRADDFIKILMPDVDWNIKRLRLLDDNLEELL